MPQLAIPKILGDKRYPAHLQARAEIYQARATEACALLGEIPGVKINCPSGAFYLTVMFEPGVLNNRRTLRIDNPKVRKLVEELVANGPNDQRFVYYLLGATGICVVPLTGFCCKRDGYRVTLLECDDERRRWTFKTLSEAMREYLNS